MFGLKIITKCQFDMMNEHIENLTEDNMRLRERVDERTSNNKELYDEICSLNKIIESQKDSEVKNLKDYFIVKSNDYRCEKCAFESEDCKKLIFANQTICVTDKKNVNSFVKNKKAKK